ncbi:BTB/POZ domain-containing protein 3-like protein [Aphelenchoides avenae]|nr:BTB/POZ domain-containing protein 3-like protein [Aphelenchus avenae]
MAAPDKDLKERMRKLLLDKKTHDVTFAVGPAMFFGELERPAVVDIPDGTPEAFRVLLNYVYTSEADFSLDNVNDVLYLSDKYMLEKLYQRAIDFIKSHLTPANVFDVLSTSKMFNGLEDRCMNFIDEHTTVVLKSGKFLEVDHALLSRILTRDGLSANEIDVYAAAVAWAKAELQRKNTETTPDAIRGILGQALYLVRFPVMDSKVYANGPDKAGTLSNEERLSLYRWFVLGQTPEAFVTRKRGYASFGAEAGHSSWVLGQKPIQVQPLRGLRNYRR